MDIVHTEFSWNAWTFIAAQIFRQRITLISSGSLPTRQVQMFDVAIPIVVELVLSASYILPPSSSPASFVLVFLFIFFLAFSFRLPFLSVILLLECVRSTSFVWFLLCVWGIFPLQSFPIFLHFVLCSVQLTFSILLQVHISKASSLFMSDMHQD